jgi:hypothetical protein
MGSVYRARFLGRPDLLLEAEVGERALAAGVEHEPGDLALADMKRLTVSVSPIAPLIPPRPVMRPNTSTRSSSSARYSSA